MFSVNDCIIYNNLSIKFFNTFKIDVKVQYLIRIDNLNQLVYFYKKFKNLGMRIFFIGMGSNILFVENFYGVIFINNIKGIYLYQDINNWYISVYSGEIWNNVVKYSIYNNIYGLENLSFIPGCVGSAIIQNIGSYGVEVSKFCNYVEVVDFSLSELVIFNNLDCDFNYRNSIFKRYFNFYFVLLVNFKINKFNKIYLLHSDLKFYSNVKLNLIDIHNIIFNLRRYKIPDYKFIGNAGSFFKNPIVGNDLFFFLLKKYSNIPYSVINFNSIKLYAGWLINMCKLSGEYSNIFNNNYISVGKFNSLIITKNCCDTNGINIVKFALNIIRVVYIKFYVILYLEVDLISHVGIKDICIY